MPARQRIVAKRSHFRMVRLERTSRHPPSSSALTASIAPRHARPNRRENGFTVLKNVKEVRHFRRVGGTVALNKEWFKHVSAHSLIRARDHLRRAHVAKLQHSFATQRLEPLIVAINSTALIEFL